MCRIHPSISPELLRLLSNSKVDQAEDVISELLERGYLEVEGDDWWKFEVLMAMITRASISTVVVFLLSPFRLTSLLECSGEADSVRVRIVSANDNLTINQVHCDVPPERRTTFICVQDNFRELHGPLSSTGVSASTAAAITDRGHGRAGPSSLVYDLEAGPSEGAPPFPDISFRSLIGGWYHVKSPQPLW
jgi:hypothetical protein